MTFQYNELPLLIDCPICLHLIKQEQSIKIGVILSDKTLILFSMILFSCNTLQSYKTLGLEILEFHKLTVKAHLN